MENLFTAENARTVSEINEKAPLLSILKWIELSASKGANTHLFQSDKIIKWEAELLALGYSVVQQNSEVLVSWERKETDKVKPEAIHVKEMNKDGSYEKYLCINLSELFGDKKYLDLRYLREAINATSKDETCKSTKTIDIIKNDGDGGVWINLSELKSSGVIGFEKLTLSELIELATLKNLTVSFT